MEKHYMHATVGFVMRLLQDPTVSDELKTFVLDGKSTGEALSWLESRPADAILSCGHADCADAVKHCE